MLNDSNQKKMFKTKTLDPQFCKNFSKEVETRVAENPEVGYMDAVTELCELHDVEPESIAKHISKVLKDKIKVEAQDLNMLPREVNGELPS